MRTPHDDLPLFGGKQVRETRAKVRRGGWAWGPVEGAKLRVLSLGAGVQSTTLALMAAHGEIGPMPDMALFADTGDETEGTKENLRWLSSGNVLPFPVKVVSKGRRLSDDIRAKAAGTARGVSMPVYTSKGQMRRQCTREFKTEVLEAAEREALGFLPRQKIPAKSVEVWIGFSTDEVIRAGAAFSPWAAHRFPFLEERMSITDCIRWLERHGYPVPPRSKCLQCPFRDDAEWRWMRDNEPGAWAEAIEIDALVRHSGLRAEGFLHPSLKPLAEVDLRNAEDRGQGMLMVCEAGCGL